MSTSSTPGSRFVGRSRELARLEELLERGARLVTLLGPTGIGKSRLSREMTLRQPERWDEVVHVELAHATSIEEACAYVAEALGASAVSTATTAVSDQIGLILSRRGRTLLVLDDVERLGAALGETVARWVRRAPELELVVTSRRSLDVPDETVFELPPLALNEEEGRPSEAAELFIARATAVDPRLASDRESARALQSAAQDVVTLLEGVPLAIELAATRLRSLSPTDLAQRLAEGDRTASIAGGQARVQHRETTQAALDWAWSQLDDVERSVLTQCSVFRGGFDLRTAEQVVATAHDRPVLDVIESLRSRSLLASATRGPSLRIDMLALVRDHVERRPDHAAEREAAARRLALVMSARGAALARAWSERCDRRARDALVADVANLRVALEWARAGHESGIALLTAAALAELTVHETPGEGRVLLDEALRSIAAAADRVSPEQRLWATRSYATIALACRLPGAAQSAVAALDALRACWSDEDRVVRLLFSSELATRAASHEAGLAAALEAERAALDLGSRDLEARALVRVAHARWRAGRARDARAAAQAALHVAQESGNARAGVEALAIAGVADRSQGAIASAVVMFREMADRARASGWVASEIRADVELGWTLARAGALPDARAHQMRAHHRASEVGLGAEPLVQMALAASLIESGHESDGRSVLERAIASARVHDDATSAELAQSALAWIEGSQSSLARTAAAPTLLEAPGGEDMELAIGILRGAPELGGDLSDGAHAYWARSLLARRERGRSARPQSDVPPRPAEGVQRPEMLVRDGGARIRLPSGQWVRLPKRSPVCNVLMTLVDAHRTMPGLAVELGALFAGGWPGERALPNAARSRVYMAISKLRSIGLRELLVRDESGYYLDPTIAVSQAEQ